MTETPSGRDGTTSAASRPHQAAADPGSDAVQTARTAAAHPGDRTAAALAARHPDRPRRPRPQPPSQGMPADVLALLLLLVVIILVMSLGAAMTAA